MVVQCTGDREPEVREIESVSSDFDLSQLPDSLYSQQDRELIRQYLPAEVRDTLVARGVPPDYYLRFMHVKGVNFEDTLAKPRYYFIYYTNGVNFGEIEVIEDLDTAFVLKYQFENLLPGQWAHVSLKDLTQDGRPEVLCSCSGGRRRLSTFYIFEDIRGHIKMISPLRVPISEAIVGKRIEFGNSDDDPALEIMVQNEAEGRPNDERAFIMNVFDYDTTMFMYTLLKTDTVDVLTPEIRTRSGQVNPKRGGPQFPQKDDSLFDRRLPIVRDRDSQ